MSLLRFFRRGDQLTADRLNEIVNAVEPTADLQSKPPRLNTKDSNIILVQNETSAAIKASTLVSVDKILGVDGLTVEQAQNKTRNDGICLRAINGGTAGAKPGFAALTLEPIALHGYGKARYVGGLIFTVADYNIAFPSLGSFDRIIPIANGSFWPVSQQSPGFRVIDGFDTPNTEIASYNKDVFLVVDGTWCPGFITEKSNPLYSDLLTSADLTWQK